MKYSDLIQFDPIESVVQLREADREASARRLVETYVISDRMAEQLASLVFEQLQFETPADNKGLLVVGNYGTGKSHLMAVISAVAEHEGFADALTHPLVQDHAEKVTGKFVVIRSEINSSMSLRQFVMETLKDELAEHDVFFDVPAEDKVRNHKDVFASMMAAFTEAFPDKGLLFVLDELLDYLRSNKEQELMRNLNFLRAAGEFCKGSRFRFIAGVQESLFDNPRFQFAAASLRRVKDRFEQMRIAREDVAHVVSERLLKKDDRQRSLVREHLQRFAPLYGTMNERMDEFVRLFPVHPAYIDTFERVYVAEKREVLKTLSAAIGRLLEKEVPGDKPGVVAYDSYWQNLKDNPSFRSVPDIRDVIEKSDVLESRIQQAFTRPAYRPAALRIIHALSVHRLTTSDINAPIGVTAEELRDTLCIILPMPEHDADFLKTIVETVMKEIMKTVSGQFISSNQENGQFFLDLKKDIDFDSLITKRADSLSLSQLDRYYFDALQQVVLEDPSRDPLAGGYRIWEHELEWRERRAGRRGYLFFGAPNERSTAQPPRDFYIYFLQPFEAVFFKDKLQADEVFFQFTRKEDEDFMNALRLYAGAREMSMTASGDNKRIYQDKATEHLRVLTRWLQQHLTSVFEVTYQGSARTIGELLQTLFARTPSRGNVRDYVNVAAAVCLESRFADVAPDYPRFSVTITSDNRKQAVKDALRWIGGGVQNKVGTAVLDALGLLDGDQLRPRKSKYSRGILRELEKKQDNQVLNRSELVELDSGIEYWEEFRLEPEFLAVVLAALVHSGDLVLHITGKKIDASLIDEFAKRGVKELIEFKHVSRPRDIPLNALQELCELLDVPKALVVDASKRDEGAAAIQAKVATLVNQAVVGQSKLGDMVFWGRAVLDEQERAEWTSKLAALKTFLESLQSYNTGGKLKSFPHSFDAIQEQRLNLALLGELEALLQLLQQVGPIASYLSKAEAILGAEHPWALDVRDKRTELMGKLIDPKHRGDATFQRELEGALTALKESYKASYMADHGRARLGANADSEKGRLTKDRRLKQLQGLAPIEMMPSQQLRSFENELFGVKTCFSLTLAELDNDPICPHCNYRPVEEPARKTSVDARVRKLDSRLDELVQEWTSTLLTNLEDPTVASNVELVSDPESKKQLMSFLDERELPDVIESSFVNALQEVLSGLERVSFTDDALRHALTDGGVPCTLEELQERFEAFIGRLTIGKERSKVRFVLERRGDNV